MSIKRRLTLTMLGISLAAILLAVSAITFYLIYDMRESTRQELDVTAAITGDRNSAALVFLDNTRATQNLEIFRLKPAIQIACIYDAQGMLFSAYRTDDPAAKLACPPEVPAMSKPGPDMLASLRDIEQGGEKVGSTYIVSDTREIDAYVNKIVLISSTVAALVLGITLLLTFYFQRAISGPILELTAIAQSITANRDYNIEASTHYQDETGILARAFNAMLGEVRKRDRELMEANETLEQKVVERTRELERAKHKAEQASEAKSEFLRNMSHEFRTPLHAVTSFAAYGIREYETAPAAQIRQYFQFIQTSTERLCKLVNEVLDLAKLEHGEHKFLLKRSDMRELLTRSAETVQGLLKDKNITLKFDCPDEPVMAVCDRDKIVQVLTNLLGNAIKFTPAGSTITLHTHVEGEQSDAQVAVSVIDQGVGIPDDEKESIFESFRQSSRTNTGAGGTGLGLAICRGIVQAHGGRIWADNNENGPGASVSFVLPAVQVEGTRVINLHTTEVHHEDAA